MNSKKAKVDRILKKLNSGNRVEQSDAAEALSFHGDDDERVVPALKKELIKNEAWEVRRACAISLGWIGDNAKNALDELRQLILNEEDLEVSSWIGWAIVKIGTQEDLSLVYPTLEKLTDSKMKFTLSYEIIANHGIEEQKAINIIEDLIENQELTEEDIKLYKEIFGIISFQEVIERTSTHFSQFTIVDIQEKLTKIEEKLKELGLIDIMNDIVKKIQNEQIREKELLQNMYNTLDQRRIILSRYVSSNMKDIERTQYRIDYLENRINKQNVVYKRVFLFSLFLFIGVIIILILITINLF